MNFVTFNLLILSEMVVRRDILPLRLIPFRSGCRYHNIPWFGSIGWSDYSIFFQVVEQPCRSSITDTQTPLQERRRCLPRLCYQLHCVFVHIVVNLTVAVNSLPSARLCRPELKYCIIVLRLTLFLQK